MSWNIKIVGTRAGAKAAILADQNIPAGIKSSVVEIIDAAEKTHVRVEGYGHTGGGWGSIGKLEVEQLTFVPDPAPAPASEAPASPA